MNNSTLNVELADTPEKLYILWRAYAHIIKTAVPINNPILAYENMVRSEILERCAEELEMCLRLQKVIKDKK
jgi:hypothetical protein